MVDNNWKKPVVGINSSHGEIHMLLQWLKYTNVQQLSAFNLHISQSIKFKLCFEMVSKKNLNAKSGLNKTLQMLQEKETFLPISKSVIATIKRRVGSLIFEFEGLYNDPTSKNKNKIEFNRK